MCLMQPVHLQCAGRSSLVLHDLFTTHLKARNLVSWLKPLSKERLKPAFGEACWTLFFQDLAGEGIMPFIQSHPTSPGGL